MDIDRMSQTREIAIFEITVAIKDPLFFGPLEKVDKALSQVLDRIQGLFENDLFGDHLKAELDMLIELFNRRWPKYKDSWKQMPFHSLVQRLVGPRGEFTEFMTAIESGDWTRIRDEALDSILVLFFIVQHARGRIEK